MEWYFRSDADDLVVPKNQAPLEIISSPDSWSHWGITTFGGSEYPTKKTFRDDTNMTREELTFNGKGFDNYNFAKQRADSNNSSHNREQTDYTDLCQGLYGCSLLLNQEQTGYQFMEDQATTNQMDDIFFSSLLEEDLNNAENLYDTSKYSPESYIDGLGSSRYLQTHAFSQSTGLENGIPGSFPVVKQESLNGYMGEETSLEESVLQELEQVTAQFTAKTRLCFRDAFYRLAENSKQLENSNQDGDIIMEALLTSDDETLRERDTEVRESKTNAIDRAVANLIFSNAAFDDEDSETSYHYTDLAVDAEVPSVS